MQNSLQSLQRKVIEFRNERDWVQFHNAKDLAISISLEAAEVLEIFQWKSPQEVESMNHDPDTTSKIGHEMADVLIYLLLLADRLKIDLDNAVIEKLEINRAKYPIEKSYGKSTKYSEL